MSLSISSLLKNRPTLSGSSINDDDEEDKEEEEEGAASEEWEEVEKVERRDLGVKRRESLGVE